jgi:plasmid replication initiation protein
MDKEIQPYTHAGIARFCQEFALKVREKIFTAKEIRAIYLITSYTKTPAPGENSQTVKIPYDDLVFNKVTTAASHNHDPFKELEQIAQNLNKFIVGERSTIKDDEGNIQRVVEFSSVFHKVKMVENEAMTIELNNEFASEFFLLKKAFTQMDVKVLSQCSSKYASALYPLFKTMAYKGNALSSWAGEVITIEQLRDALGIPNGQYSVWGNFLKRILAPALKDINESTGLNVVATPLKEGRSFKKVRFMVTEDNKKFTEQSLFEVDFPNCDPAIFELMDNLGIKKTRLITKHYDEKNPDLLYKVLICARDKTKSMPLKHRGGFIVKRIEEFFTIYEAEEVQQKVFKKAKFNDRAIKNIKDSEQARINNTFDYMFTNEADLLSPWIAQALDNDKDLKAFEDSPNFKIVVKCHLLMKEDFKQFLDDFAEEKEAQGIEF